MTEEKRKRILDLTHELCKELKPESYGVVIDTLENILSSSQNGYARNAIIDVLSLRRQLGFSDLIQSQEEADYARGEEIKS